MEIVLVLMLVFGFAVVGLLIFSQAGEPPRRGSRAPEFTLPDQGGRERTLAEFRGRRLALFFFPMDETPECLAVIDRFRARRADLEATATALVAVAVTRPDAAAAYGRTHGFVDPILCDGPGKVAKAYGALVNVVVMKLARKLFVVVDAQGRVLRAFADITSPDHVDALLAYLASPEVDRL
jgi:peroxiredoxin Q/BCP